MLSRKPKHAIPTTHCIALSDTTNEATGTRELFKDNLSAVTSKPHLICYVSFLQFSQVLGLSLPDRASQSNCHAIRSCGRACKYHRQLLVKGSITYGEAHLSCACTRTRYEDVLITVGRFCSPRKNSRLSCRRLSQIDI